MPIEFFLDIIPPTVTHQEKDITVRKGKPIVYEPAELKTARAKLEAHLGKHVPSAPFTGPVDLLTIWCFPLAGRHKNGEYRTTRPDTDNLQKMLKDVMTHLHYWRDDALVASETVKKFWAEKPGIYIRIMELGV